MFGTLRSRLAPFLIVLGFALAPARLWGQASLMVYDFELTGTPASKVDQVRALGFSGLVTRCSFPQDLPKLTEYSNYVGGLSQFRLLAYVEYDFNNPGSATVWTDALPVLAQRGAPLWVIVRNAPGPRAIRQLLGRMAQRSQLVGVPTVVYPHWNTDIETAAEAAQYIAQIGHPNLRNSLHTCHEIRGGNQLALGDVVTAHVAGTALVTIAGADPGAYAGPPTGQTIPWDDAIKPLDRGAFSLEPFLGALDQAGYSGPVVLHTFGVVGDPGHLSRSLDAYDKYLADLP